MNKTEFNKNNLLQNIYTRINNFHKYQENLIRKYNEIERSHQNNYVKNCSNLPPTKKKKKYLPVIHKNLFEKGRTGHCS